MAKSNPTEKQVDTKIQAKHAPAWKLTEEEMQSLSLQITRIDLHHELELLLWICFLLDYFQFILNVFVADYEHMLFAGKDIEQKPALF